MPTDWRIYDEDTVAYRLDRAELPGFFRKQIVAGPGEFALVVENGQLKGTMTEEAETVAGLLDSLLGLFKRGSDIEVVFASAAEFEVIVDLAEEEFGPATVKALSQDGQPITAQCKFVLQVPEARAHQLAIFMAGRKSLATWDVAEMLKAELLSRVLLPKLRQHKAEELWTNNDLQGGLVGLVKDEFGRLFGARGFALNDFVILWGMTDDEKAQLERQRLEREDRAVEFEHDRQVKDLMRERETEEVRLANLQALRVAQEQGDQEMTELMLAGEMRIADMRGQQQLSGAMLDAQIAEVQIELERKRSAADLEQDRQRRLLELDMQEREAKREAAQAQAESDRELSDDERRAKLRMTEADAGSARDMEEMATLVALKKQKDDAKHSRQLEAQREEAEAEFQRKKQESDARYQQQLLAHQAEMRRMQMTETVVTGAGGAATADVLQTMLKESTKQQTLGASDDKMRAITDADSADAKLRDYQQAEDRERAHQQQMAAAPPPSPAGPSPAQTPQASPGSTCPSCQAAVEPGWKVCPSCGAKLPAPDPTCPSCGEAVQADWKACPACGGKLAAPGSACQKCGGQIQAGWKACPACGSPLGPPKCPGCGADVQSGWKACPACGKALV